MKVLILAAGRGERMRPLTDTLPKPLLPVTGIPLIEHLIVALAQSKFKEIVINHSYLGDKIIERLGDGHRLGVDLQYSEEPAQALETGGGILKALPLLNSDPFVVLNSDIWTDYPFAELPRKLDALAHLILVDNPKHHPNGDFILDDAGLVKPKDTHDESIPTLTFSGIGVYRHKLFKHCTPGRFPLAPIIINAAKQGHISGQHYQGRWIDVGTPERLNELERAITQSAS